MPYIRQVSDAEVDADENTDAHKAAQRELAAARKRAGRVWNIVRIMTPNPAALRASMNLYSALMFGESPLTRAQRELLAVVVSRSNHCRY
ncbi:MAG: carboxymuconolactone decarboxylase family protein [Anaerolineaceae bacterium]|nr:carboxymuconolactone decarboxylase family protein [Anaerolineaceae bacterium]MCY4009777.1 carboxymuconolactone decarboxylase family protein [Anaerolineaceae bacterium]MCY4106112.1 carboxymuconolactone decarboxylase family protein [Chloroflexota bacterium]